MRDDDIKLTDSGTTASGLRDIAQYHGFNTTIGPDFEPLSEGRLLDNLLAGRKRVLRETAAFLYTRLCHWRERFYALEHTIAALNRDREQAAARINELEAQIKELQRGKTDSGAGSELSSYAAPSYREGAHQGAGRSQVRDHDGPRSPLRVPPALHRLLQRFHLPILRR